MARLATVALSHRDNLSQGHSRRVFGCDAFHWGIVVMPENSHGRDCNAYEATDASEIDPVTFRMNNPHMDWWLRTREQIDPEVSSKLIGRVVIGQIPENVSDSQLHDFFLSIPLPVKNTNPQQSCVTWTVNAILALQSQNWAWNFDVEPFKVWALVYADKRMSGLDSKLPKVVTYSARN
ncbi:hypothetical protein NOR_00371 [Metarhizium rileyi]|uniref:Uncharacterized protein n=1 Tax=Metarhizium rileyi (strain RCEF 4871) TaxID=1649241 RepID=A0A162K0P9_METRR|nr:hypothetical protein NOR_00371 [Metarhizium rileyi RCEF 4871]TWU73113.1 hypothetical protein ED733_004982 [Metarhizium rileyi]